MTALNRDEARAMRVGRLVLQLAEELGIGDATAPAEYHQDALPPGARSRGAYLERHRQRRRARVPGWTKQGNARLVTAAAWAADAAVETARSRLATATEMVESTSTADAALDQQLGIRPRRGAS